MQGTFQSGMLVHSEVYSCGLMLVGAPRHVISSKSTHMASRRRRGSSPALVLSKTSVRAAYEQGNGSLPIQFWDEDGLESPRSLGSSHQVYLDHLPVASVANQYPPPFYHSRSTRVRPH